MASTDRATAAAAESPPDSIRRWSSASEIIGMGSWQRRNRFYGREADAASGPHVIPLSFRGASKASEPGIHNHDWGLWIPGLRQGAHPGMTRKLTKMLITADHDAEDGTT
jgi:hypothetical protein